MMQELSHPLYVVLIPSSYTVPRPALGGIAQECSTFCPAGMACQAGCQKVEN